MQVGRPKIYESNEQLEKAVYSYFFTTELESNDLGGHSEVVRENKKPTITGLTLHLGFADKTTLYDYRDRPEFSHSIKWALTMIEKYHEEGLSENNVTGRIFALKNMGWRDKTETELNAKVEVTKPTWFDDGIETKAT